MTPRLFSTMLAIALLVAILLGSAGCSAKSFRTVAVTAKSLEIIKSGSTFVEAVTSGGAQSSQP